MIFIKLKKKYRLYLFSSSNRMLSIDFKINEKYIRIFKNLRYFHKNKNNHLCKIIIDIKTIIKKRL